VSGVPDKPCQDFPTILPGEPLSDGSRVGV
jgi:hypothetical protein